MPTPIEWLSEFQANTGTAETGTQNQPQIIGLSNGNILVAWDELSVGVGASNGSDVVGKIFDAEGNVVRDSFQINAVRAVDNEGDFDIAATNDGGFIMAYVDEDISTPNHTTIVWERYDADGTPVSSGVVADENIAADDISNPQIALNFTDNSFVVTFTDLAGGDTNVNAVHVEFTNMAGTTFTQSTEFSAAQNSSDIDDIGDVAILANGNYVGTNREFDGATPGIDIHIFQPDGTIVRSIQNFALGINAAPRVSGLANGNFVVVWNQTNSNNGDIFGRIYDAAGDLVTPMTITITGTDNSENEPDVQALPDGGFVVFWDDESFGLRAQKFLADGTADGSVFDVAEGAASDSDVGVAADGRILFAWQEAGEMFASFWDGRENPIEVANYKMGAPNFLNATGPITSFLGDSVVNGSADDDLLVGYFGDDTMSGGGGADTIEGNAGRDSLLGGAGADLLFGFGSHDTLLGGAGDDDVRGGFGRDLLNGSGGNDILRGFEGDDRLFGGGNNDTLVGNDGNDSLTGGGGEDRLKGDAGADTLNGRFGDDLVSGGGGDDTFEFRQGHGNDTYDDFVAGSFSSLDQIELIGFGAAFDTFAEVLAAASDNGTHTTIDFGGGDSILLLNVVVADLHEDDFVFS